MSQQDLAGYVADVEYPRHFFRETMPLWLTSVTTALGRRAPDLTAPYTWLELGCGSGLGAVLAAATNPLGRFIGIDFNPDAIEHARALAEAAGVANAQFLALGFEQALDTSEQALPPCDFIVVHGVYSWIAPTQRRAIQALVRQRLKPGGILYLNYLSQPGSASFAAAQRMMYLHTQGLAGSAARKAREAVALLHDMADAGLGYFQDFPNALANIPAADALDEAGAAYHAHDYLNRHWEALHVSDVMQDFAAADCEFVGSAAPYENIDNASLPGRAQALLRRLRRRGASAAEVETFKDLARNQLSRADLYQRRHPDGNLLGDEALRQALLAQRVCLLPAAPRGAVTMQGTLTLQSRIGPVRLPIHNVAPLLDALQGSPRSYAELAQLPAYADRPGTINGLLQILAWAGWLHFVRPDLAHGAEWSDAADDAAGRFNDALTKLPEPYNGAIRAHGLIGSAVSVPARPTDAPQASHMS
ncbi:methyltransferase domain-containing protein [Verticiella sediminum]|uniref:Methyltransferase domain-containing protein n=1 Tax=Verticiella sediminum TaxID=1247510 RepID=A0A556ALW0_9BURK|nr:class I SAM-dependent methyltransferase [Verticiella sediminum]TSH93879.1 methyltransferase domain-containing protein [Verticiella sediminum]